MRVTGKGQVTIPGHIRKKLAITTETEVDFIEENGKVYLVKSKSQNKKQRFRRMRGIATIKLSTEEIMKLTREE